ncbi:hypothetical protein PU683_03900 [Kosakonia cowanii]|uniref:hypothetical protein n=1 Tax=Kosakonia cowanii TaxID=208223 RepID=UPI0023F6482C|nr:hypothetical protein [Kosakonia cowanii]MDF7758680.1 hypothetical protein [Kosakonia cowanii]
MRNSLSLLALLVSTSGMAATLHSGIYEELQLAVSPQGKITGYYSETLGVGVTRTCAFALAGEVSAKGDAKIASWSSEVLPGHLVATADGLTLTVPGGQSHDGCVNAMLPLINDGLALGKTRDTAWQSMAQVRAERLYFYRQPEETTRRKAWIVQDDVVGVLQTKGEWTQVEYLSDEGKSTTGWVKSAALAPLTPPHA